MAINPSGPEGPNDHESERRSTHHETGASFHLNDRTIALVQAWRTPLASGLASVASTFTAFPLDLVKSRMQSYGTRLIPTVMETYHAEGLRAFWRGVIPPLLSVTLVRTFSFTFYQQNKVRVSDRIEDLTGTNPLIEASISRSPTFGSAFCYASAGALSGAVVSALACPFELTKLDSQIRGKVALEASGKKTISPKDLKVSAFKTAGRLWRERGFFPGLYCGYRLHFTRDVFGTAIYFTTYEIVKQSLSNGEGPSSANPFAVTAGGMACGIVSWTLTYPLDVAKTIYQKAALTNSTNKTIPTPRVQWLKVSTYNGLGISCARSATINMIFFFIYERLKTDIHGMHSNREDDDHDDSTD